MCPRELTIGFDTSNYTTSAAVFDMTVGEIVANIKRPLPVAHGERGLRQSDALFAHIKNLPEVCKELEGSYSYDELRAIGYSAYPRDEAGSYMPCFLAGKSAASALATAGAPSFAFSHQAGHVMAAIWHCGRRELVSREHIAFHVSGGTTEALLVKPAECGFDIKRLGGTLDINAGQLIDRTGVLLGYDFPCGPALEAAACEFIKSGKKCTIHQKPIVVGVACNLSGAENKVMRAINEGHDVGEIAYFVLDLIARTLDMMTNEAMAVSAPLPVVYAGGVMSNSIIKKYLSDRHDAAFAPPVYSADNACGTAILAAQSIMSKT